VELAESDVDALIKAVSERPGLEAIVDLDAQSIVAVGDSPLRFRFELDPTVRETLMKGLDEVQQSLEYTDDIRRFESTHDAQMPAAPAR
jgi:3-isopropylmalate/(R)-2-methylmalate dehydratase small subunit